LEQSELDLEAAKDKVEDCGCDISDIPVFKQKWVDLEAKTAELRASQ